MRNLKKNRYKKIMSEKPYRSQSSLKKNRNRNSPSKIRSYNRSQSANRISAKSLV